jgi:DNA-3-methyladenine glycosylase
MAARRPASRPRDLARGPARLCQALGVARDQNGLDVCTPGGEMTVLEGKPADPGLIRSGPRTGVAAAKDVPWRFWIDGDPTVSPYRPHVPKQRKKITTEG